MTDYAKLLNELEIGCTDADIDGGGAYEDAITIARALLKERDSLQRSYDDLLSISDRIGKEKDAAYLEVYELHSEGLSTVRMTVICDCVICSGVMPPIEKANVSTNND